MSLTPAVVAVCGMPRSGNRLVQRLLQHHGFVAEVRHYGRRSAFRVGGVHPDCAVMMLRDRVAHEKSCADAGSLLPYPEGFPPGLLGSHSVEYEHFWPTLRWLAEAGVAVLPVSYEALVADPELEGQVIVAWCHDGSSRFKHGSPLWKGWPEPVVDGNAKWRPKLYLCDCGWVGTVDEMEADYTTPSGAGDEAWSNHICPSCKAWNQLDDYEEVVT